VQKPPTRPVRTLIVVLLLADLAAIIYMNIVLGFPSIPLQAFPPYYWILLAIGPLVLFMAILVWGSAAPTGSAVRNKDRLHPGIILTMAGACLLIAFVNNLTQPRWGGNTAVFLWLGCIWLLVGYAEYRRSRLLK